jgi:hypothetical protein
MQLCENKKQHIVYSTANIEHEGCANQIILAYLCTHKGIFSLFLPNIKKNNDENLSFRFLPQKIYFRLMENT